MILFRYIKIILLILFPLFAHAAVPEWKIIPNESSLTFSGIQNNSPVTAKFTQFSGKIQFDPDALNESSVNIVVDTNSVSASYKDLVDTLKTSDWFNVKAFPNAVFEAKEFKKTGDETYEAMGQLTIRDKTLPVTITFEVLEMKGDKVKVKGYTILKRNAFGVGQGEWSSTEEIKDEVKVNFILSVNK